MMWIWTVRPNHVNSLHSLSFSCFSFVSLLYFIFFILFLHGIIVLVGFFFFLTRKGKGKGIHVDFRVLERLCCLRNKTNLKCTGEYVRKKTWVLLEFSSVCIQFATVSIDLWYACSTFISIFMTAPSWK